MKTPIIVGYDPGTTAALAIISTKGEILFLKSKRGYKRNEVIYNITETGKPLIIAGDRSPLPKSVEKLASTLGCKAFNPEHSLSVVEKNELTGEFSERLRDNHEKDALASAIRAFKFHSKLFRRTSEMLASVGLSNLYDRVVEIVIQGKVDNINNAINRILTETGMNKKTEISEKKISEPIVSKQTVVKLQEKIKSLEKDIGILRKSNEGLRDKIRTSEEKAGYYRNRLEQKVDSSSLETMKKNIEKFRNELTKKESLIKKLKTFRRLELEGYNPVIEIEEIRSNLVSEMNDILGLEDRIILTKNPENAQILNDYKVKALIVSKKLDEALLKKTDFPILTEKDISIEKIKDVLAVKKEDFEERIKNARKSGIVEWIKGHRERRL